MPIVNVQQGTYISHKDSLPLPSIQLLELFVQQQITSKLPTGIARLQGCATRLEEDDGGMQNDPNELSMYTA